MISAEHISLACVNIPNSLQSPVQEILLQCLRFTLNMGEHLAILIEGLDQNLPDEIHLIFLARGVGQIGLAVNR